MKIGILTLHSNTNFGGGLQQIAMFEVLKSLGHEPQFLCVRNDQPNSAFKRAIGILTSYTFRQLFDAVEEAFCRVLKTKKNQTPNTELYKKTDEFNYTKLNYTPKFDVVDLPKYASECDVLVFGSDQVWTDVYSDILPYFGDGIEGFNGKRIAFAACSVHKRVPVYNIGKIEKLLSEFDAISVRDETTKKLVQNYSEKDPQIVCDPTLLYDFKPYLKPSPIEGDYIFVYVLGDKPIEWHQRIINRIKEVTGINKVVVMTTSLDEEYIWADNVITDALAVDWMNILRAAKFVYTNSFHAVLFSLKFHRQFVAYYGDIVRSSRMLGLRRQFGLDDRIVREPNSVDFNKPLDFTATDRIIEELAGFSMSFLKKSINK